MRLGELGIKATFHYTPLHAAPAGRRFGRVAGSLAKTEDLASRLVRLPLYADITLDDQEHVVRALRNSEIAKAPRSVSECPVWRGVPLPSGSQRRQF